MDQPTRPTKPQRTIRVSDKLWQAAQEKAASEQETVSDVIRRALEKYVGKE